MRITFGLAAAVLVAACQQAPADPTVDHAWVRLPAVAGNPGAAYFTLHGGSSAGTLVKVSAPFAVRAEMHETMEMDHGAMAGMDHDAMANMGASMTGMQPVKDVALPARGEVKFAPAGRHVMLFDVAPTVKPGAKVPLTLDFADGKKLTVSAMVVGAGDPEPN
ncbi:copper chaperone PCu(A)C [Sphingomonas sp.]|uniref:copper chaperone PCu(A)C n=1 Tax=Sphingomonas sp. TaxID=28214 RepID=UPI001B1E9AE5|nr:copper chaperone PCu(A)C [Sphingomonas sp.]MBO9715128.1 copper chaperone PCu(A)C [Sphingomonas sp.]